MIWKIESLKPIYSGRHLLLSLYTCMLHICLMFVQIGLVVQLKPLCVIALRQTKTDNINRMITITDYFDVIDHSKQLITLTMIRLIGFHYNKGVPSLIWKFEIVTNALRGTWGCQKNFHCFSVLLHFSDSPSASSLPIPYFKEFPNYCETL